MKNNLDFITDKLGPCELLAILEDEAEALGHAALDLGFAYSQKREITDEDQSQLLEACASVSLMLKAVGLDTPMNRMRLGRLIEKKQEDVIEGLSIDEEQQSLFCCI